MSTLSVIMGVDVSGGDAPPTSRTQAWSEEPKAAPKAPSPKPAPKEEKMDVALTDEEKEALAFKDEGNKAYKAYKEALEVQENYNGGWLSGFCKW